MLGWDAAGHLNKSLDAVHDHGGFHGDGGDAH